MSSAAPKPCSDRSANRCPGTSYLAASALVDQCVGRSAYPNGISYVADGACTASGKHAFRSSCASCQSASVWNSSRGGELRVSLLRAPKYPDTEADMGRHAFAYALLPHAGGWREAGVLAEAQRFNAPLRWAEAPPGPGSFAACEAGLVLDTVKRAEDSDALVLRLYEPYGGRGVTRVRIANGARSARLANALEDDGDALDVEDGAVVVPYRPHEVLTVKVQ